MHWSAAPPPVPPAVPRPGPREGTLTDISSEKSFVCNFFFEISRHVAQQQVFPKYWESELGGESSSKEIRQQMWSSKLFLSFLNFYYKLPSLSPVFLSFFGCEHLTARAFERFRRCRIFAKFQQVSRSSPLPDLNHNGREFICRLRTLLRCGASTAGTSPGGNFPVLQCANDSKLRCRPSQIASCEIESPRGRRASVFIIYL